MVDILTHNRSSSKIRDIALAWREVLNVNNCYVPDIAWLLEAKLPQLLDAFSFLVVRSSDLNGDHAKTIFDPPTIITGQEIYTQGCESDPFARCVLTHEFGHLVQHETLPKSFSATDRAYRTGPLSMSSEWQADEFTFHFLCPEHIVSGFESPEEIAENCRVTEILARRAFDSCVTFQRPRKLPESVSSFLRSFED